jgi:hypothetical protein
LNSYDLAKQDLVVGFSREAELSMLFHYKEDQQAELLYPIHVSCRLPDPICSEPRFATSAVPGTFYKFMQVLGVERVRKLFFVKEIAVLKFWDGIRGILALDARKYKF